MAEKKKTVEKLNDMGMDISLIVVREIMFSQNEHFLTTCPYYVFRGNINNCTTKQKVQIQKKKCLKLLRSRVDCKYLPDW